MQEYTGNYSNSPEASSEKMPAEDSRFAGKIWNRCRQYCSSPRGSHITGVLIIVLVLWLVLGSLGIVSSGDFPPVQKTKWQAVFLSNNQVYFGHLENYNRHYVLIKDVYYLQVAQPLQQSGQQPGNITLIKLGNELHGPEDIIFIPKDKILFWENMKDDSQVVKGISASAK